MIRVAVIDSGIDFDHPHLKLPAVGCSVLEDGEPREGDIDDTAGHGTCCAALIHWLAPDAELHAIKVLPADLRVSGALLARAIEVAAARGCRILNVSIGTLEPTHRERLAVACESARKVGATVVAAALPRRRDLLPAGLPAVVPVAPLMPPELLAYDEREWPHWFAGLSARPAEGCKTNFRGPSMAAARVSGALARLGQEGQPDPLVALMEMARGLRQAQWLR